MMFQRKRDPLTDAMGWWSRETPLTVSDMLRNTMIMGMTGSGKTSGSGLMVAHAAVGYPGSSGLWLASKPEDKALVTSLFERHGRSEDLIVIEPGGKKTCNLMEYERSKGADTRDLTQFCMTMKETIDKRTGSHRDPFWINQNERMIFNAIEICQYSGHIDPWQLQLVINDHASSPEMLVDDEWKNGDHYRALAVAYNAEKTKIQEHDFKLAWQYWTREVPAMNDRTLTSILAGVLQLLHVWNTGVVRHSLADETNFSPADLEKGRWLFVNAPVVAGDSTSTFFNAAIKFVVQRHALRRHAVSTSPLIAIYSDEYPKICNSYDTAFLAECRSHKACMVVLMQSLPGLVEAMNDDKHAAQALLANTFNKCFHLLGDADSAEYASSLLGNYLETEVGGGEEGNKSPGERLLGRSSYHMNYSRRWNPILQSSKLLGGLRTGGAPHYAVDGILIRGGDYEYVTFQQERR